MLTKLRIIFLLTIGLSNYGSTFIALPRFSEEGSVSLSPQNNYVGEIESRLIPIPFGGFGLFRNKQRVKTDVATLQTQVAKLNADVALLNRQVAQLTQFQRRANATIQTLKANGVNTTTLSNALAALNGSSSSNRRGRCPVAVQNMGKVIGTFCYIVRSELLNFNAAQTACVGLNGNLAEPLPRFVVSFNLYTDLKRNFPREFRTIENAANANPGTLWIGYLQETNMGDFLGLNTPRGVPSNNVIFNGAIDIATSPDGAAITNTGFWDIFSTDTTLPYICRFPLI